MKKINFLLGLACTTAIVGAMFAFRANPASKIYTPDVDGHCTVELIGFSTLPPGSPELRQATDQPTMAECAEIQVYRND